MKGFFTLLLFGFPALVYTQDSSATRFLCFEETLFQMDTLQEGDISEARFRFRVCDTAPVVIHQVWPGCGCTVADYPKDTLFPDSVYMISLRFFSEGRPGYFFRSAPILYHSVNPGENNPYAETQVSITGFVLPKIQNPPPILPETKRRQRRKSR
ncbi:MAG: DUF1573 domain-containing protein [Bacteroidetes bacterium]|nr:DUF1573 domain-containing protein [Bacteroidota bacterium]